MMLDQELYAITMPLYANTQAEAIEERKIREEVYHTFYEIGDPDIIAIPRDELMQKLIPIPSTDDLEGVYRLKVPFVNRYIKRFYLEVSTLEQIQRFMAAYVDLTVKEQKIFRQKVEKSFGPKQWEHSLEMLERDWAETRRSEQG